ncbi:MAG: serine/threonine protein kinase [Gemmataceae bacterium]|nr:serine/threonine protein kinase [Gemmataceae bacterium]
MAAHSVPTLVQTIGQFRLLPNSHQARLSSELQGRFQDVRDLSKHLVQLGWLTPYQINQLLGNGADLTVGPYHLLERIGEGGMGQVYKARHQKLNRIAAVKLIRKENRMNPNAVQRFQREAMAAAQLSHPNIVTLYDADHVSETYFLAMEYVEGTDLAALVKQRGRLPIAEACEYIRQAAIGLHHAHERGLIHRDIKPSNLLIVSGSTPGEPSLVKVLDMGLARLTSTGAAEEGGKEVTQMGAVVGTADFMAPEQAKNASTTDRRADIYSLGCTLYYLLAGQTPFAGANCVEKLLHHQLDEVPAIEKQRPQVPRELRAILRKLLAKKPEDRFQTAAQVASALQPLCRAQSIRFWPTTRRNRLLAATGIALFGLVMFGLIGSVAMSGGHEEAPPATTPAVAAPTTTAAEEPTTREKRGDRGDRGKRPDFGGGRGKDGGRPFGPGGPGPRP